MRGRERFGGRDVEGERQQHEIEREREKCGKGERVKEIGGRRRDEEIE